MHVDRHSMMDASDVFRGGIHTQLSSPYGVDVWLHHTSQTAPSTFNELNREVASLSCCVAPTRRAAATEYSPRKGVPSSTY